MDEPIRTNVTLGDYLRLPDDGIRYEVLEGDLVMSSSPGFRHQHISMRLSALLYEWHLRHDPHGVVLTAPFDVVLANDTIVQPDIIYLSSGRRGLMVKERLHGPPDLAVEIFHKAGAARDRIAKLRIYARFQIVEYWLVDLDARTVTMLELSADGNQVLERSRVMVGLELDAGALFDGI